MNLDHGESPGFQWLLMLVVSKRWEVGSIFWGPPNEGKDYKLVYKWYFYCHLGEYMLPIPPFRNNH